MFRKLITSAVLALGLAGASALPAQAFHGGGGGFHGGGFHGGGFHGGGFHGGGIPRGLWGIPRRLWRNSTEGLPIAASPSAMTASAGASSPSSVWALGSLSPGPLRLSTIMTTHTTTPPATAICTGNGCGTATVASTPWCASARNGQARVQVSVQVRRGRKSISTSPDGWQWLPE